MPKDSVIAVPRPRPATIVASVTRNGVMRRTTTQKALIAPKTAPVGEPDEDAGDDAEAALHAGKLQQVADRHRRQVHVRADREVDAGGQQHEGHADGDDADERRLLDDVERVLGAEEIVGAAGRNRRRRR